MLIARIMPVMMLIVRALTVEPSCSACSKYDYEERLLGKLIRMEISFKTLLKEVQQRNKEVTDALLTVPNVLRDIETHQAAAENEMLILNQNVLDNVNTALKEVRRTSENLTLQTDQRWEELKGKAVSPTVVFHAHNPTATNPATGQTIVYSIEESNIGEGYNIATGLFTAPVSGLYLFHTQTCVYYNKHVFLAIVKENNILQTSSYYDKDHYPCSSAEVLVQLAKSDRVWVKCTGSSSQLYHDSNRWTGFGGALIHG